MKFDEFYTGYDDIHNEIKQYKSQLQGSHVFLPCDNPICSNFYKYFHDNFNDFKLSMLTATYFIEGYNTFLTSYDGNTETITPLFTNGDFRTQEITQLAQEADIIVTNPPFSLFREFMDWVVLSKKKFIVLGPQNALSYQNIFTYIQQDLLHVGYNYNKAYEFVVPSHYSLKNGYVDTDGIKHVTVNGICWFTNFNLFDKQVFSYTGTVYNPDKFYVYENYPAINVDKLSDVPDNYDGVMGVPITYLNVHSPRYFQLISQGRGERMKDSFLLDYKKQGGKGAYGHGNRLLHYYDRNGNAKIPYMRILIKRI